MVQKTITEQRLLFDSEGLDQGDCLCHDIQQGQSTDLPVIPWASSLSRRSAHSVQDALSCVQGSCSLFSRALRVADTLPLS